MLLEYGKKLGVTYTLVENEQRNSGFNVTVLGKDWFLINYVNYSFSNKFISRKFLERTTSCFTETAEEYTSYFKRTSKIQRASRALHTYYNF